MRDNLPASTDDVYQRRTSVMEPTTAEMRLMKSTGMHDAPVYSCYE